MRSLILKNLDLGGNGRKLGRNVIFDSADSTHLAEYLYTLRVDDATPKDDGHEIEEMETMIKRYLTFKKHVPRSIPASLVGEVGSSG